MHGQEILRKTDKGLEEVEHRKFGLAMRSRRVLIMVDGKRTLADIERNSQDAELRPTMDKLIAEGFIEITPGTEAPAKPAAPEPAPVAAKAAPAATPSPSAPAAAPAPKAPEAAAPTAGPANAKEQEVVNAVRDFMILQVRSYIIGWRGLEMIDKLEHARSLPELRKLSPDWHSAISKSSSGGKSTADELLANIREFLDAT